jgi:hypothetical protein
MTLPREPPPLPSVLGTFALQVSSARPAARQAPARANAPQDRTTPNLAPSRSLRAKVFHVQREPTASRVPRASATVSHAPRASTASWVPQTAQGRRPAQKDCTARQARRIAAARGNVAKETTARLAPSPSRALGSVARDSFVPRVPLPQAVRTPARQATRRTTVTV